MKIDPQALRFTEAVVQDNARGGHNVYFRDFEVMNAVNRIQRARARNLVGRLRARGLLTADALEKRSGYSCEGWDDFDRRLYARSRWCIDTAGRITAKYLGEGT